MQKTLIVMQNTHDKYAVIFQIQKKPKPEQSLPTGEKRVNKSKSTKPLHNY